MLLVFGTHFIGWLLKTLCRNKKMQWTGLRYQGLAETEAHDPFQGNKAAQRTLKPDSNMYDHAVLTVCDLRLSLASEKGFNGGYGC